MTALKPLDGWGVHPVAATRYVLNAVCGHPDCTKPTDSAHHIWPRSFLGSDSWFVNLSPLPGSGERPQAGNGMGTNGGAIPHVIGLCGSGTTGHHGDLEEHRAWIRLEDGEFVWYERTSEARDYGEEDIWTLVAPLNPQPGSREGKPKRRRKASTPEERKARVNHTIRTPKDEENVLPELIQLGRDRWADELGWTSTVPDYYVVTAAFAKALQ